MPDHYLRASAFFFPCVFVPLRLCVYFFQQSWCQAPESPASNASKTQPDRPPKLVPGTRVGVLAMSGDLAVANRCGKQCVQDPPCHDAIRFLGVVGSVEDLPLLKKLAQGEQTVQPALQALGILGASESIPELINMLSHTRTAHVAANSLERITGRGVARTDPPAPPEHLTEEELDFWSNPGDPIPEVAHEWWRQNHYYFERSKRYQAGKCVSGNPLGDGFDELPDRIQKDVYLRERALNPQMTPDWELDTWPCYQHNPSWASRSKA